MPKDRQTLTTSRLELRLVDASDPSDFIANDRRNTEQLRPWEPTRDAATAFDEVARAATLATGLTEAAARHKYRFVAREPKDNSHIVAVVTLSNVEGGVFLAGNIGYSVDEARQGSGFAREAGAAIVAFAFDDLGLHRLMANYRPENSRSGGLLRRLSFVPEGYARDYLFIDGAWRDRVLTALVRSVGVSDPG